MRTVIGATVALLFAVVCCRGQEVSTFKAYVDSDICARLMAGHISEARVRCSQQTHGEGSKPVLINLSTTNVFTVDKPKMLNEMVGQFAQASGEVKAKDGRMKLTEATPLAADAIPAGDPARRLIDAQANAASDPRVYEAVRHELAMMPYITEFDFISFTLSGGDVILTGWTVRASNRNTAQNVVKHIEGVQRVINNIEVLPMGSMDMRLRASARAALQRFLPRYFWGNGSAIRIIVMNGDVLLLGTVLNQGDVDLATVQCRSLPGSFHVFNMLRVESEQAQAAKS